MISTRFARMGALVSAFVTTVSVVEGEGGSRFDLVGLETCQPSSTFGKKGKRPKANSIVSTGPQVPSGKPVNPGFSSSPLSGRT